MAKRSPPANPLTAKVLLTSDEAATFLRVHPKHIYRLLRKGMPGRRVGGKWLFSPDELLSWAEQRGNGELAAAKAEPEARSSTPLLAASGDLAVELLLSLLQESGRGPMGMVLADRMQGLAMLRKGEVLLSGWHGDDEFPRDAGVPLARVHLVRREVGLLLSPAARLTSFADVARLRLASRPTTSGLRARFDAALTASGLDSAAVHQASLILPSHRDVACAIASGKADVGIGSRAWAEHMGLGFLGFATESYGLLVHKSRLAEPLFLALCELSQSAEYRTAIRSTPGYDASEAGKLVMGQARGGVG